MTEEEEHSGFESASFLDCECGTRVQTLCVVAAPKTVICPRCGSVYALEWQDGSDLCYGLIEKQ